MTIEVYYGKNAEKRTRNALLILVLCKIYSIFLGNNNKYLVDMVGLLK